MTVYVVALILAVLLLAMHYRDRDTDPMWRGFYMGLSTATILFNLALLAREIVHL